MNDLTLKERATQIRNEQSQYANSAERVGSFLEDLVDKVNENREVLQVSTSAPANNILVSSANGPTVTGWKIWEITDKTVLSNKNGILIIDSAFETKFRASNNSGSLLMSRMGNVNKMFLTPKGGELHLGVGKQGDFPLDKISIGYRGMGDMLRAGSLPNYYHLASDPSKNTNNRFMRVRIAEYVHDVELGSNTRNVYLGHQAENIYLRGSNTYIDTVPNGSYGDVGGLLAVNNAGKVYKINKQNIIQWLGFNQVNAKITNLNQIVSNLQSSEFGGIGINNLNQQ